MRQLDIKDDIPTEMEVGTAVKEKNGDRRGVPSGMCEEDLKGWLQEATRKKELVRRRWDIVVILVQRTLGDGTPPSDRVWETMVLIL